MEKGTFSGVQNDIKGTPGLMRVVVGVLLALLIGALGYYQVVAMRFEKEREEFASSTAAFSQMVNDLNQQVTILAADNEELRDDLRAEKRKNSDFEEQIEDIAGTVSVLDKLRKTDEELLKKYSKVSFLNEHYLPEGLTAIKDKFVFGSKELRVHKRVDSFLDDLLEDAEDDDIDLEIVSAYRSFGTQAALKSQYTVIYGTGANQFSADQGYSEHQLGTTLDFSTPELVGQLEGFELTEAYKWLLVNAHKYGFVLSYPPNNAYYEFEPWHWRFVGVDLATDLYKDKKYFYDLDQREINEYLVSLFD